MEDLELRGLRGGEVPLTGLDSISNAGFSAYSRGFSLLDSALDRARSGSISGECGQAGPRSVRAVPLVLIQLSLDVRQLGSGALDRVWRESSHLKVEHEPCLQLADIERLGDSVLC